MAGRGSGFGSLSSSTAASEIINARSRAAVVRESLAGNERHSCMIVWLALRLPALLCCVVLPLSSYRAPLPRLFSMVFLDDSRVSLFASVLLLSFSFYSSLFLQRVMILQSFVHRF